VSTTSDQHQHHHSVSQQAVAAEGEQSTEQSNNAQLAANSAMDTTSDLTAHTLVLPVDVSTGRGSAEGSVTMPPPKLHTVQDNQPPPPTTTESQVVDIQVPIVVAIAEYSQLSTIESIPPVIECEEMDCPYASESQDNLVNITCELLVCILHCCVLTLTVCYVSQRLLLLINPRL